MYEYRIVCKRQGQQKKNFKSRSVRLIQRRTYLLGDTPWKAFGKEPYDFICCDGKSLDWSGEICGCKGETYKEQAETMKAQLPPVEYIKVEYREVGEWKDGQGLVDQVF